RTKTEEIERASVSEREHLAELGRQLQDAEAKLTDYMAANRLARSGNGAPEPPELASLGTELAAARADLAAKEGRMAQLRDVQSRHFGYESIPEVGASVIIQKLQEQAAALLSQEAQLTSVYGPRHRSVQEVSAERESIRRRIADETANIARGIAEDVDRARQRVHSMELSFVGSMGQYFASERASVKSTELTRLLDTISGQYRTALTVLNDLDGQRRLVQPDARLISAATPPEQPSFPRLGVMIATGCAASILLAIGFAAFAEHADSTMRGSRQVEQRLGLPNLAIVPKVKRRRRLGRPLNYITDRPQSAYTEAIRSLILGIEQGAAFQPKVLLVTSAWPGEGKTTLVVSLAALLARRGRRVVVVDLDLRHPKVARELGLRVRAGLEDYVKGKSALDDVLHAALGERSMCIVAPNGAIADPSEVLGSPRLKTLISMLRARYDIVLIDVPPSLGPVDAQTAGLLADAALFVVRWGSTSEDAALNGLEALQKARVSILGCVLTQVDLEKHAFYGHHDQGEFYQTYRDYFPS
ncbi:MAG: AAA family ATPase, partial [Acetobacteraceae bacterium]|nr:AAA family ATPase [Acetobacteraceae bacterium]